jgi:hypothetical protein
VLVAQHLGGQGSLLVNILRRRIALPVSWIEDGDSVKPGHVLVCPPGKCLEVLPNRTCSLSPLERTTKEKPLDFFLESLADSVGPRTLAVVLTGMGKDSAGGARKLKNVGGIVLVQSENSAEQPSMPRATIEAGAADLVLPLHEIGTVIATVISGGKLPQPRHEREAVEALFGRRRSAGCVARCELVGDLAGSRAKLVSKSTHRCRHDPCIPFPDVHLLGTGVYSNL